VLLTLSHKGRQLQTCSPVNITDTKTHCTSSKVKVKFSNNIDNQLDATITDLLTPISSTCFGRWLRPSSGASDCVYSLWYNALTMLLAGGQDAEHPDHRLATILMLAGVMDEMEHMFHLIHQHCCQLVSWIRWNICSILSINIAAGWCHG